MKPLILLLLSVLFVQSGWSQRKSKRYQYTKDYKYTFNNLVAVPQGAITAKAKDGSSKTTAVLAFRVLNREVTNKEYRSFVYAVRDSIARDMVGYFMDLPNGKNGVDWEQPLDWSPKGDLDVTDDLGNPFFENKQNYVYVQHNEKKDIHIPVYPDSSFWSKDPTFAKYQDYFHNPKYDDFPVLGVSKKQAEAFCDWKTQTLRGDGKKMSVSLPTERQWIYLAMLKTNEKNKAQKSKTPPLKLSFNLFEDQDPARQQATIVAANSGVPNDLKIYNLLGNVAEWVQTGSTNEVLAKTGILATSNGKRKISTYRYSSNKKNSPLVGFRICVN